VDDNIFWLRVWQIIGGVVCVLIVSLASCTANQNYIIKEMAGNGVSALDAACAISPTNMGSNCTLRAAK